MSIFSGKNLHFKMSVKIKVSNSDDNKSHFKLTNMMHTLENLTICRLSFLIQIDVRSKEITALCLSIIKYSEF